MYIKCAYNDRYDLAARVRTSATPAEMELLMKVVPDGNFVHVMKEATMALFQLREHQWEEFGLKLQNSNSETRYVLPNHGANLGAGVPQGALAKQARENLLYLMGTFTSGATAASGRSAVSPLPTCSTVQVA